MGARVAISDDRAILYLDDGGCLSFSEGDDLLYETKSGHTLNAEISTVYSEHEGMSPTVRPETVKLEFVGRISLQELRDRKYQFQGSRANRDSLICGYYMTVETFAQRYDDDRIVPVE